MFDDSYSEELLARTQAEGRAPSNEELAALYIGEKRRRKELRDAHSLLNAVFASIPGGLMVLDADLIIQQANPGFSRLVNMPLQEVIGQQVAEVVLSNEIHAVFEQAARQSNPLYFKELTIVQPIEDPETGSMNLERRSFLLNLSRMELEDSFGWVAVLLDQTENKRLYDAFGRYVTPIVADQIMSQGVNLGGDTIYATALFTDIRDFTRLSSIMSASAIVEILNDYFTAIEPVIKDAGGWISKFGGDSLLAVFGAPLTIPNHEEHAVKAALGIRAALKDFNRRRSGAGWPELRIGIGLASGEMVSGSVGTPDRMEYTVIGDTVNIASRIEALNKLWGTDLLISESVYAKVKQLVKTVRMPPAQVQGKEEAIQVYSII